MRATVIVAFGVLTLFTNNGVVAHRSPRNLRRVAAAGEENDVRMKALIPTTSISTTFEPEGERGITGGLTEKLRGFLKDVYLKRYARLQAANMNQAIAIKGLQKKKIRVDKLRRYLRLDKVKNHHLDDGNVSWNTLCFWRMKELY